MSMEPLPSTSNEPIESREACNDLRGYFRHCFWPLRRQCSHRRTWVTKGAAISDRHVTGDRSCLPIGIAGSWGFGDRSFFQQ